jgi:hypothetical protein
MRSRRVGPVIVLLVLAAVLLGTGVASARPAQTRIDPALEQSKLTPAGHAGKHCNTHPDPVAPDPTDV